MAKVKHVANGKPSPKNEVPTPKKTTPPPPPLSDLTALPSGLPPPPSFPNVPFSIIIKKSIPSLPPIVPKLAPPPAKKVTPPTPFIKGQIGHVFFTMSQPRSYLEMPHGYSLIIGSFRKPFSHEHVKTNYIIVDPLGNNWTSPEVFNIWRETVERGEVPDIDQKLFRIAIVRLGNEFRLCSSSHKKSFKEQIITIKDGHQLADEDKCEKKDPDYVPEESNEELD